MKSVLWILVVLVVSLTAWIRPVPVQAFRLGEEVAIVALPGELFVELGLAIKRASPFETTLVIELAHSAPGATESFPLPAPIVWSGGLTPSIVVVEYRSLAPLPHLSPLFGGQNYEARPWPSSSVLEVKTMRLEGRRLFLPPTPSS